MIFFGFNKNDNTASLPIFSIQTVIEIRPSTLAAETLMHFALI